jgi:hypothetical protein
VVVLRVPLAVALWVVGCSASSVDLGGHPAPCGSADGGGQATPEASPGGASDAEGGGDANGNPEAAPGPGVEAGEDVAAADATEEGPEAAADSAPPSEAATDAPPDALPAFPATCSDGIRDGDETDIDCGGSCAGCGTHGFCNSDSDCSATASGCAAAYGGCYCQSVSQECVGDHCEDFRLDGDETGVDCGGSLCIPCPNGTACRVDHDCGSRACDAIMLVCIADQCADHQLDGMETDVDCGGASIYASGCPACAPGKTCRVNSDCQPGYACSATHVCI